MTSSRVLSSPRHGGITAEGDPTVERAVVDLIWRSGRLALPPVHGSDDGFVAMLSSDILFRIVMEASL